MQRRYVPTVSELQAFEACARLGAASAAARELHLTQSAISRAVAGLEKRLGVTLFHRVRQRLVLSDAGRVLAGEASKLLTSLDNAAMMAMAFGGQDNILRLAVLPTFGTNWLAPRLGAFHKRYPDVMLDVATRLFAIDFETDPFDLAILRAPASSAGPGCEFLMEERLTVVAAPRLLQDMPPDAEDALWQLPLLQQSTRPELWLDWFRDTDMDPRYILRGPRFEQFGMVIEAAAAGTGLALVPEPLVRDALARGDLQRASERTLISNSPYMMMYPERSRDLPGFRAFHDWLSATAAADYG